MEEEEEHHNNLSRITLLRSTAMARSTLHSTEEVEVMAAVAVAMAVAAAMVVVEGVGVGVADVVVEVGVAVVKLLPPPQWQSWNFSLLDKIIESSS